MSCVAFCKSSLTSQTGLRRYTTLNVTASHPSISSNSSTGQARQGIVIIELSSSTCFQPFAGKALHLFAWSPIDQVPIMTGCMCWQESLIPLRDDIEKLLGNAAPPWACVIREFLLSIQVSHMYKLHSSNQPHKSLTRTTQALLFLD
jgi:hypothetical protein